MEYIQILDKLVNWFISINWSMFVAPVFMLFGIFINEHFRRKDRETLFSERIFDKKLEVYERLHLKMRIIFEIVKTYSINPSQENKLDLLKENILDMIDYLDDKSLFIDEEIAKSCLSVINSLAIEEFKGEEEFKKISLLEKGITLLIKKEIGLERLDNFYNKINKKKTASKYTKIVQELRKRYKTE